ncbi:MAG: DUF2294 domain-containing protein [Armatimonadetes bacterium]|nr:DUF2294 domain-containing protein [Armatimonadota bacterium]MDE2207242.1 DUF2294 domain-containing protein [Armatimonadota bacterium]
MNRQTKGSIEAEVGNAVVKFQREQQGRGPAQVEVHLHRDLLLVRCSGVFTATETRLASTPEGKKLIRSARHELRVISRAEIEAEIAGIVGCPVLRSYGEIDTDVAELIEVYVLDEDVEKRLA